MWNGRVGMWLRLVVAAAVVTVAACSGSSGSSSSTRSPLATAALRIMVQNGCSSCHGTTGTGGVGPSWVGLLGSTVRLTDGSTVTADDAYIRRSITDPSSQLVQGYTVAMPLNRLSPADLATMVEYIESLGTAAPTATSTTSAP